MVESSFMPQIQAHSRFSENSPWFLHCLLFYSRRTSWKTTMINNQWLNTLVKCKRSSILSLKKLETSWNSAGIVAWNCDCPEPLAWRARCLQSIAKTPGWVYQYLTAAVTDFHQSGGAKQCTVILYGSGHQKSEIHFTGLKSRAIHSPEALGENPFLRLHSFL